MLEVLRKQTVRLAKTIFPYRFSSFNLLFTRFCNASCRMCVKTHYDDKVKSRIYLDQGTLENALRQLGSMGVRDINIFAMSEPLVHPKFNDYIGQIVNAGFRVIFSTNGELLKRKHFEALNKVHSIGYSIEGYDDETVRHYRGVSFQKVIDGLAGLRETVGNKPLTLRTTLYRGMEEAYLGKFMSVWAKYFDELVVTAANPPHLYHTPLPTDINCSLDEFYTFKRNPRKRCEITRSEVAILPNGDVAECTEDYASRFLFGNINDKHLKEIIEGEDLARFHARLREGVENVCGECTVFYSIIPEHGAIVERLAGRAHEIFQTMKAGNAG